MISVLVYPDRSKVANPYIHDLTAPNEQADFDDWSPLRALRGRFDLLHIHWPESIWNESSLVASTVRGIAFIGLVRWAAFRGSAIVTTIHNLAPHDNAHPKLNKWFTRWLDRSVDRVHILAESARPHTVRRFHPSVAIDLVPMGNFIDNYDGAPLSHRENVVLHFGGISAYKNTVHLIRSFLAASTHAWNLVVAGKPATEALRAEVIQAAHGDDRITLRLEQIGESEVPELHGSAKLAVLPFTAIENSSTVMLALSLGVPVVAPRMGAMPDLAAVVGDRWLRLYDGDLSTDDLEQALVWADLDREGRPDLSRFDWVSVREALISSYQTTVQKKRGDQ